MQEIAANLIQKIAADKLEPHPDCSCIHLADCSWYNLEPHPDLIQ
jgi:hypothetical protein